MADYRNSKYMLHVKQIVGPHLLTDSTFEQDTKEATDLLVLMARDMRLAVRVREPGYLPQFDNQITIRSKVRSGTLTEIHKIERGWGDWFFYGHGDGKGSVIKWWLVDLDAFRWNLNFCRPFILIGHHIPNGDGTFFDAFDVRNFSADPKVVIASSHEVEPVEEAMQG